MPVGKSSTAPPSFTAGIVRRTILAVIGVEKISSRRLWTNVTLREWETKVSADSPENKDGKVRGWVEGLMILSEEFN